MSVHTRPTRLADAKRWLALGGLSLLQASCAQTIEPATQIVVSIDSDLKLGSQLTEVAIDVLKADGSEPGRTAFAPVPIAKNESDAKQNRKKRLPLTLSITPGNEDKVMVRVVGSGVHGEDNQLRALVEQRAVVSFKPAQTQLLHVYLGQVCIDVACATQPGQVCYPTALANVSAGKCGAVGAFSASQTEAVAAEELPTLTATTTGAGTPTDSAGAAGSKPRDAGTTGDMPGASNTVATMPAGSTARDAGTMGDMAGASDTVATMPADGTSATSSGAAVDASVAPPATPTSTTGGTSTTPAHCLDGITDFGAEGPFGYALQTDGAIKFWVPAVPTGCKVPVVHLAVGTGGTCADYQGSLNRIASHGFLAACYENTNTGAGTMGLMAFQVALSMFPDLADKRLGSTGHSQGGQAAFVTLALAEEKFGADFVYAGLAMEPASGFGTQPAGGSWQSYYAKVKSPMFMFSGSADMLVSEGWVKSAYDAMNPANEVYWWSAIGATHMPPPDKEEMEISIPWFRWKLLGDQAACRFFKAMPGNGKWEKKLSENEAPCL